MKFYLAVGHGEQPSGVHDPGAVGNGWSEQKAGDIIVATIAADLSKRGHEVRHEANQKDPNFYGTVAQANAWDADYTLAVHHDWSGSRIGSHGFYFDDSSKGKPFGQAILTAVEEAGWPVTWTWFRARNLYLLRRTNHPAFLLEAGPIGDGRLDTEQELRAFGHAVADGILEAFPGTRPAPEPTPDKETPVSKRFPNAWAWAEELGLANEDTDPADGVEKEEFFALLQRYDRAVVDALAAEIGRLERKLAGFPQSTPTSVDEADIAARVETRIRASLKESL